MSRVSIKGNASGTGTLTIEAPNTNTDRTLTLPDYSGNVAVDGPAFSAWLNGSQTVSNATWTKAQFNTEDFDTASCYDNATNYRFTPNIAGYYQINWCLNLYSTGAISSSESIAKKNGEYFKRGISGSAYSVGSLLVYMNGSTDYIEIFGNINSVGTPSFGNTASYESHFSGYLVRRA